jgi:superfamily I DNA/RNA helicase
MKALSQVNPTPEQLVLITNPRPGVHLIRGAAGSGKTTTALLMLRHLCGFWLRRRQRQNIPGKIDVLVITFNRTLRGYIYDLAQKQIQKPQELNLTVTTFGKWSRDLFPNTHVLDGYEKEQNIKELSVNVQLADDFIIGEVEYILGRFPEGHLPDYLLCNRIGRGNSPRLERNIRQTLLDQVVHPYIQWKRQIQKVDWNDLALMICELPPHKTYDIIIADEAQDLSANEIRAIMKVAADPSSIVFVIDTAQRIYPRGFTWAEAGVSKITGSHRLKGNYRNTKEICMFAFPLLKGLEIGDDGTFPDFDSCERCGPYPILIKGLYSQQVDYVLDHIEKNIDLSTESVAFLKPRGRHWFDTLKAALGNHGLKYVEITREAEWPTGPENIALSTMNSAKGLEFDHVFILGLNDEITPHGEGPEDTSLENWRRVLAMAITRARTSVIVGYKPGEASILVSYLDPKTYREVCL